MIYNPGAGRFPSRLLAERAAHLLERSGWQIDIEGTLNGDHIRSLATQAVERNMTALFVVGGDGSINKALPPLLGSETALAVLPAGTANVWAQEVGLPCLGWTRWLALEESARLLADGQIRWVDAGLCNQHPFLLWAGIGLDGFVVHRIEPRTRRDKNLAVVQYATSALLSAASWEGISLRIITQEGEVSGHFLLAVASNIHLYAGGFAELSPHALLDDGVMDLWLFKGSSMTDTIQRAWDLWAGRHIQSDQVQCLPVRQASINSQVHIHVQLDGEPIPREENISIKVLPKSLKVLLPRHLPRQLFHEPLNEGQCGYNTAHGSK
jgi:diacylglycerol kinase (ATP)